MDEIRAAGSLLFYNHEPICTKKWRSEKMITQKKNVSQFGERTMWLLFRRGSADPRETGTGDFGG